MSETSRFTPVSSPQHDDDEDDVEPVTHRFDDDYDGHPAPTTAASMRRRRRMLQSGRFVSCPSPHAIIEPDNNTTTSATGKKIAPFRFIDDSSVNGTYDVAPSPLPHGTHHDKNTSLKAYRKHSVFSTDATLGNPWEYEHADLKKSAHHPLPLNDVVQVTAENSSVFASSTSGNSPNKAPLILIHNNKTSLLQHQREMRFLRKEMEKREQQQRGFGGGGGGGGFDHPQQHLDPLTRSATATGQRLNVNERIAQQSLRTKKNRLWASHAWDRMEDKLRQKRHNTATGGHLSSAFLHHDQGEESDSGDEDRVAMKQLMRFGGRSAVDNTVGVPTFCMPTPPPQPGEEQALQEERTKAFHWRWQLEPGFDVPLYLLACRRVDVHAHRDIVSYHMVPELLRDVQRLKQGAYLVKYNRKGGIPHERFFTVQMSQHNPHRPPEAVLMWKMHSASCTILDRVPLMNLVGVSWDATSPAFSRFRVYPNNNNNSNAQQQQQRAGAGAGAGNEDETSSHASYTSSEMFLEGPTIGPNDRSRHPARNALTLWFFDRRSMSPKSIDIVAKSYQMAVLWVSVMRGLLAINSVCVGEEEKEDQAILMNWVREELDKYDVEGESLTFDIEND